MPRNINAPRAKLGHIRRVIGIDTGGTGSSNINDAVIALNAVPKSLIGQPNGLVPIGSDGKIPLNYFSNNVILGATVCTVEGPLSVAKNSSNSYTITNYDVFTTYNIVPKNGTINSFNLVTGSFNFVSNNVDSYGGFSINGIDYPVKIGNPLDQVVYTTTSSGSINIPAGVKSITVTGKGQDGWNVVNQDSSVTYFNGVDVTLSHKEAGSQVIAKTFTYKGGTGDSLPIADSLTETYVMTNPDNPGTLTYNVTANGSLVIKFNY